MIFASSVSNVARVAALARRKIQAAGAGVLSSGVPAVSTALRGYWLNGV